MSHIPSQLIDSGSISNVENPDDGAFVTGGCNASPRGIELDGRKLPSVSRDHGYRCEIERVENLQWQGKARHWHGGSSTAYFLPWRKQGCYRLLWLESVTHEKLIVKLRGVVLFYLKLPHTRMSRVCQEAVVGVDRQRAQSGLVGWRLTYRVKHFHVADVVDVERLFKTHNQALQKYIKQKMLQQLRKYLLKNIWRRWYFLEQWELQLPSAHQHQIGW